MNLCQITSRDYENQVQPIRSLGCQLTHNSYEVFSCIVMLTLRRDNTFGSSATHKKVYVQSILADVVTGSICHGSSSENKGVRI